MTDPSRPNIRRATQIWSATVAPDCLCQWRPADDGEGSWMTERIDTCPLHGAERPRKLALRTTAIHPACICEWDPTPSGFVMTRRVEHCVVHKHLTEENWPHDSA